MMTRKHVITRRVAPVLLAAITAVAMIPGFSTDAKANVSTATYDAPTNAMDVNSNILTGTAHRAASPILGMMGLNAKSGFGMINGSAPTDLASASKSAAVGIWGTSINDSPDPYYWNYFYNFYVDANPDAGLTKSSYALMNPGVSASPMQADTTLNTEYGNVSVSLSTRPDVVIGTAAKGAAESDTHGYDDQIATINGFAQDSEYYQAGDENYSPALVAYTRATLVDMISSAKRIGAAMDEITDESNGIRTGRYPDQNGHSSYIADEYEDFIYGLQAYIMSKIDKKKTVAIVSSKNDDGTFTIADASTQEATSSNRYVEYTDIVGDNVASTLGTTLTADQLASVDVIILSNFNSEGFTDASGQAVTFYQLLKEQENYNANQIIIENYPSALYGITMNSVENAMGMAYITSYMYSDNEAVGLDPVSMCAYYYQKFYHISDINNLKEAIAINFASVTLPEGMAGTLSDSYSAEEIAGKIEAGKHYYARKPEVFAATYIGKAGWNPADTDFHTWNAGEETKAATCTEDGVMTFTCTACGVTETKAIPSLGGHSWDQGKVTTAATCTKKGVKTYTCSACGETKTEDIAAKGHTYKTTTTKATASKNGSIKTVCSVCGDVKSTKTIYYPKTVKAKKASAAYTGKAIKPGVTVTDANGKTIAASNYTVKYSNNTKIGTATATVTFKGNYSGTKKATFKIVKAKQPMTVKVAKKTVSYAKVKKAKQVVAPFTITKAQGTKTFKKVSGSKYLSVAKSTGKVTVKKKTPKGTYKIKVQIKADGNSNYNSGTKTVTATVTVK